MPRPNTITNAQLLQWDNNLNQTISADILELSLIKEVCYAGLYLAEELDKLSCPEDLIVRIQFTAGQLSFGRDPWEVSNQLIEDYKDNKLSYE